MNCGFNMKRREDKNIPPEKLYMILQAIYPKDVSDELYKELTGLEPPMERKAEQQGGLANGLDH